jgi:hypothetical protein
MKSQSFTIVAGATVAVLATIGLDAQGEIDLYLGADSANLLVFADDALATHTGLPITSVANQPTRITVHGEDVFVKNVSGGIHTLTVLAIVR